MTGASHSRERDRCMLLSVEGPGRIGKFCINGIPAHLGYKTTMEVYKSCIDDGPYSFLFVDLLANPPKFYCRFEKRVLVDGEK